MGTTVDDGNAPRTPYIASPPNLAEINDEHDQMHSKDFVKKTAIMTRNHFVVLKVAHYHCFLGFVLQRAHLYDKISRK